MPTTPEQYLESLSQTFKMLRQDLRQQLQRMGLERMQAYGLDITALFCLYDDIVKMEAELKRKLDESDFNPNDALCMDSLWNMQIDKED